MSPSFTMKALNAYSVKKYTDLLNAISSFFPTGFSAFYHLIILLFNYFPKYCLSEKWYKNCQGARRKWKEHFEKTHPTKCPGWVKIFICIVILEIKLYS